MSAGSAFKLLPDCFHTWRVHHVSRISVKIVAGTVFILRGASSVYVPDQQNQNSDCCQTVLMLRGTFKSLCRSGPFSVNNGRRPGHDRN